jgi:hypothetical protein
MHRVLVAVVGDKQPSRRLGIIGGVCVALLAAFVALPCIDQP